MSGTDLKRSPSSAARLAAVQALYEVDVAGAPAEDVLKTFKDTRWESFLAELGAELAEMGDELPRLPPPENRLLRAIVRGVDGHRSELDELIQAHMGGAEPFRQLEDVMKCILRAAAFEVVHAPKTPVAAIASEYVTIANAFFTENQPRLVNAVIEALGRAERDEKVAVGPTA